MDYAEAKTQTPPTVTDEQSARLLTALGPAALLELTAVIALANFMTRSNTALGIGSQGLAAACDLQPLAALSTAYAPSRASARPERRQCGMCAIIPNLHDKPRLVTPTMGHRHGNERGDDGTLLFRWLAAAVTSTCTYDLVIYPDHPGAARSATS